jgi:DNA modification methylase
VIVNADCFEYLKTIESNSVDLILTDPPYNISRSSNFDKVSDTASDFMKTKYSKHSIDFGDWDTTLDLDKLFEEYYRVLKKGGTLIIFFDVWKSNQLKEMAQKWKFKQPRVGMWLKNNPTPINSKSNYLSNAHEFFFNFVKDKKPTFNSEYDNAIYRYPLCHGKERTCLIGDTKVYTKDGLKNIKDVVIGDYVISLSGSWNRVSNTFTKKTTEIYKFKVSGINRELICTGDHEVYIKTDNMKQFQIGRDRKYGGFKHDIDHLFIEARHIYGKKKIKGSNAYSTMSTFFPKLKECNDISEDLLKFYGLYLAEGSIISNGRVVSFSFNKKEVNIISELGILVKNLFNKKIKVYDDKRSKGCMVYFCSKEISTNLKNIFGIGARNKKIPNLLFNLNKSQAIILFKYWAKGDGWIYNDSQYRVTSSSIELVTNFYFILIQHGISCNIVKKASSFKGGNTFESYVLTTSLNTQNSLNLIKKDPEVIFGNFDVYDIEVENEHNYLTEVGIVHNCHPTQKPLPLIKEMIEKHSNPDDLVLDTFSGSGTVAEACLLTGRRFICIEKDEKYYQMSIERIKQLEINKI